MTVRHVIVLISRAATPLALGVRRPFASPMNYKGPAWSSRLFVSWLWKGRHEVSIVHAMRRHHSLIKQACVLPVLADADQSTRARRWASSIQCHLVLFLRRRGKHGSSDAVCSTRFRTRSLGEGPVTLTRLSSCITTVVEGACIGGYPGRRLEHGT